MQIRLRYAVLIGADMYLLGEVAMLLSTPSAKSQVVHLERIRNHVVKMRATKDRTYVLEEDSIKPLPPKSTTRKVLPAMSTTSTLTSSRSDDWNNICSQQQSSTPESDGKEKKTTKTKPLKSLKHVSVPIIDTMSAEITDRDITTLVFKWTTLDKFYGFNRVSSQQEPEESKSPQIHVNGKSENKCKHKVKSRRGKLWALAYLSFV